MRVLFLCAELTGYFCNCIQLLKNEHEAQIRVVCWPNSNDAPFKNNLSGIEILKKNTISSPELLKSCQSMAPSIVFVAGWMDKDYKRIAKVLKRSGSIVICGLDNAWTGSFRQRIASLLAYVLIKPHYSYLWVAGHRQYQFARQLGFSYDRILSGLYAADIEQFTKIAGQPLEKYLLYVGRFETTKGIHILYSVFNSLTEKERNGWKLRMIGNGSIKDTIIPTANIEVYGFMQPGELVSFISGAGGFVLPSIIEPWGVVVQEFAASGKPLLLSNAVNSSEDYLIHNFNGFKFISGDEASLKETLKLFFALHEEERNTMGKRSAQLALRGDPRYWVANLLSVLPAE